MTIIEMVDTRISLAEMENYLFDQGMKLSGLIGRYDNDLVSRFDYEPNMQDYEYLQLQYMH